MKSQIKPWFRLFGPLAVVLEGRQFPLGTDHEQRLLVALLAARREPVSRQPLIGWVWDTPGPAAADMLDDLVTGVRRRLADLGLPEVLICERNLCRLDVDADSVDLHRFRHLVDIARSTDDWRAADFLREAVEMFDGEPFGTLCGERITDFRATLLDEYMSARIEHVERSLRLGRQQEILPSLTQLHRTEPFNQKVAGLLMLAHYQNSEPERALVTFERIRAQLAENLGVDVGEDLRALRRRILGQNGEDMVPPRAPATAPKTSHTTGDKAALGIKAFAVEHLVVNHTGHAVPAPPQPVADEVITGKKTAGTSAVAAETAYIGKAPK